MVLNPAHDAAPQPAQTPPTRKRRGGAAQATLVLAAALCTGALPAPPSQAAAASAAAAPFELTRFILNALLVPALDADALPWRWADPRPAARCGSATQVRVNGEPLRVGALVPDTPFALDWQIDHCQPLGAGGPLYQGQVRLSVYREDWGLSAMVEPASLRLQHAGREFTFSLLQRHGAWLALTDPPAWPAEPADRVYGD